MLEGVSREAGPFEFVVCADCVRVGRTVRVGLGLCARGPVDDGARLSLALEVQECARGPVDDGVRGAGAVRAGQWLGAWALLLVVVTPSCAAGPFWWQCGRPAWATTCGVNLRSEGAQAGRVQLSVYPSFCLKGLMHDE